MKDEIINATEGYGDDYGTITAQKPKKSHAFRNTAIIIGVVLILLAAAVITAFVLAFQMPNSDKFNAQPSSDLLETLVVSAVYDEDAEASNDEINSFIAYLLDEGESSAAENGEEELPIKNLALFVHKDKPCELYSQVEIGGNIFEVSGEFTVDTDIVDNEIKLTVTAAKLGSLPLPPSFILDYIFKNSNLSQDAEFLRQDGTDIYIGSEYGFNFLGQDINIGITKIQPEDNGLTVKTTSAADIILNALDSWLGALF